MGFDILENLNLFAVSGRQTHYIFIQNDLGLLKHLYWGSKMSCLDELDAGLTREVSTNDSAFETTPEEYTPYGGLRYKEPALKVTFHDGTRDVVPVYQSWEIRADVLKVRLQDNHYPLEIRLCYRVFEDVDIIERWVELQNTGNQTLTIEKAASAQFNLSGTGYHQTNVFGHWGAEQRRYREPLSFGRKSLESRRGTTGHHSNPYFILDKNADEDNGEVWFGALAHSGNFRTTFEVTPYEETRVVMGLNEYDFSWRLGAGESFVTPAVFCGYTQNGFGDMSRRLHRLARTWLMPPVHRDKLRPVLYNSWEATYFEVTCEGQMALAQKAADLGVELFVLDDGWFGRRNDDKAGLGDWQVNPEKFPQGLAPLIETVNQAGMDFGIWVEPEMVNPDSDLYRQHPDWIYTFHNRTPSQARNQLVLNLCNPEVTAYLLAVLDDLLSRHNIKFLKWDINRPLSEPGALNLAVADRPSIWLRHTRAVYQIVDTLRERHPEVAFEACASGGGRVDFGCLMHFDQFWPSDNTDALDRLMVHDAYSLIYPVKAMRAWVTDCPNFIDKRHIPLQYRFHCAMTGALGIGCNLNEMSAQELKEATALIREYKEIRHIIQNGELYRIATIGTGTAAVQYVLDQEQSVFFVFNRGEQFGREFYTFKMKGLDPRRRYNVLLGDFSFEKSGEFLMRMGLLFHLSGDYASQMLRLEAVQEG